MDLGSAETWRWIWLAVAVGFLVGEIAVAGSFFLLPFGIGGAAAAGAAFMGSSVAVSWAVFVVVSAVASAALRPLARRLDASSQPTATGVNRWVGQQGTVLADIPAGHGATGLIRLEREEWRAQSLSEQPIAAGTTVTVRRVDGTRLVVEPAPTEGI